MKILHYTLGLPPYRSGGLTKYSYDLMIEQINQGDEVSLLYPGHFNFYKGSKIRNDKTYNNIFVYELVNPLPVPLLNGISSIEKFIEKRNKNVFEEFIYRLSPDVIHIHTLMGLPIEFLKCAKEANIKIIYTTHDYFGICPTANLFTNEGKTCSDYQCGFRCIDCNKNAYGLRKVILMQSRTYRVLKSNESLKKLVLKYKKSNSRKIKSTKILDQSMNNEILSSHYRKLRKHYIDMLSLIDFFHFNSSVAKRQYEKYIDCSGEIINITHNDITDERKSYQYNNENKLKVGYLGKVSEYKGFYVLLSAFKELETSDIFDAFLEVYGDDEDNKYDVKNVTFNGRYKYIELSNIFKNIDVLFVPSIWMETYGFIVLEAMSFGIPVVVTENVGAKDLIEREKSGFIINATKNSFVEIINRLVNDRDLLVSMNNAILNADLPLDFSEHVKKIRKLYNR